MESLKRRLTSLTKRYLGLKYKGVCVCVCVCVCGGGGGGGADPSPGSATVTCKFINGIPHEDFGISLRKDMPFT